MTTVSNRLVFHSFNYGYSDHEIERDLQFGLPCGWDRVDEAIAAIESAKPTDGVGIDRPVPSEIVATARALASKIRAVFPIPDGVYPLSDGNIVFEWQFPGVNLRYEIEGYGRGQVMISPKGQLPRFVDFRIDLMAIDRFQELTVEAEKRSQAWSGLNELSLAS